MHQLSSVDLEVTFHKVIGSFEVLRTRPGVDPLVVTRPMARDWSNSATTPSDWSGVQSTPITTKLFSLPVVTSSVIAPRTSPWSEPQPIRILGPAQFLP